MAHEGGLESVRKPPRRGFVRAFFSPIVSVFAAWTSCRAYFRCPVSRNALDQGLQLSQKG